MGFFDSWSDLVAAASPWSAVEAEAVEAPEPETKVCDVGFYLCGCHAVLPSCQLRRKKSIELWWGVESICSALLHRGARLVSSRAAVTGTTSRHQSPGTARIPQSLNMRLIDLFVDRISHRTRAERRRLRASRRTRSQRRRKRKKKKKRKRRW